MLTKVLTAHVVAGDWSAAEIALKRWGLRGVMHEAIGVRIVLGVG